MQDVLVFNIQKFLTSRSTAPLARYSTRSCDFVYGFWIETRKYKQIGTQFKWLHFDL